MMLFDASSIYTAVSKGKAAALKGFYSVILARYELGNIIWKETVLRKTYSASEGISVVNFFDKILSEMKLMHPDLDAVFKTAVQFHLSYYDASYIYAAIDAKIPLVTEDKKIKDKAGKILKVYSFNEIA